MKTRDWATDEVGTEQTLYACVSADDWYAAVPGSYYGTLSCTARWGYEAGGEIVWSTDVRTQNVLVTAVVTPTYRISVSASPAPGGTLTGGGRYGQMESVTVTATPGENYEFVGWTENGVYVSYQTSYEFSASADRELVAVFNPLRYIVILDPGDGTGDSLLYDIAYQVEIPQKDQAQPGEFYYEADGSVGFRLPQDCPDAFAAPGIDLFGGWENAGEYAALTTAETTFTASWRRRIEVDYRFLGDPSLISVELCQCERLLDYSQTFEYWGAVPLSDGKAFLGWDVGVTIRLNDGLPAQSFISYYSYTTADNSQCVGSTRVLQLTPENPSFRLHFGFLGDAPLRITVAVSPLKVTFDGNGGSHASFFTDTTYDRYVSANYPSALPENEFSRRGYLFTGWNTQPDGSGVSYADGETVTFSAETTLYAQWVKFYSISTDGNVSVYRADDDWLSTPLTEALEGERLKIVMNDPDQRQVGSGKYFTGEFSLNGVGLGFENAEYGWPNYEFTMPAQAVTVRAVQADKTAYTVDLTAGAVTLPMQAFNLLAMDMDENASIDPDTDDMLYDLNGGGVPDARIHIEEQFDNEGNWIGMTAALSSEPDADAAGKYVYYYAHDPDLPYGSITVILPVTDSFDFFPAHSLTIREDIGVNFYLDLAHFDLQDARVEFSWGQKKDGSGPHTATVSLAGMTPVRVGEGSGLYRVSVRVAAKEMTDTITATLYFGEEAIRSDTYSVLEYALRIIRNPESVESDQAKRPLLRELCRTMLLYGAAAQKQFGYNVGQIVNLSMYGFSDSLEPVNYSHLISCLNHLLDNDEYALTVVGTSLLLRSKTICRLLFRPDPDTDWSGCVLRAIYPDNSMLIIPASQGSAGLVCFDVPVGAKDLMQDILLHYGTLDSRGNFDTAGSFGICNAGAYMREAWEGSNSTTRNLFTALYRYSEAAKAYADA